MRSRKNLSAHIPSASWKDWNMQENTAHTRKGSHISPARFEHMKGHIILQHDITSHNDNKETTKVSQFDAHKLSMIHTPEKPLVKRRDPNISSTASPSKRTMDEDFRPSRKLSHMTSIMIYGSGNDNKSPTRSQDPTLNIKHRKPITASKIPLAGCYLLLDDPETKNRKKMISVGYSEIPNHKTGPKTANTPLYKSSSFRMKEEYIGVMLI